jgi:hypothetical protein
LYPRPASRVAAKTSMGCNCTAKRLADVRISSGVLSRSLAVPKICDNVAMLTCTQPPLLALLDLAKMFPHHQSQLPAFLYRSQNLLAPHCCLLNFMYFATTHWRPTCPRGWHTVLSLLSSSIGFALITCLRSSPETAGLALRL